MACEFHYGVGLAIGAFTLVSPIFAVEPRPLFSQPAKTEPSSAVPAPAFIRSPESLNELLRIEREAFQRRLEVCTQLRRIAAETNDDRLLQKALELEQSAEDIFSQRIARLGVKGELRTSSATRVSPSTSDTAATAVLDRNLGTGIATTPLKADSHTPSPKRTSTATNRTFREVPQQ